MHQTAKAARIAGAIYLSMVIVAPFCMLYVPGKLIVRGDATATAANILAHETMFRLSIFGDLIGHVIFICLGIALYRLLSSVNKTWALLMVAFAIGGFVLGRLGRRPQVGDTIEQDARLMRVVALDGIRVATVWLSKTTVSKQSERDN